MKFWHYLIYDSSQRTFLKGHELFKAGSHHAAIPYFDKIIEKNPKHFLSFYLRAIARINLGELENAVSDCKSALMLKPKHERCTHNLGIAYLQLRQFQKATDAFTEAIAAGYNSRSARSQAFVGLKNFRDALRDIDEAIHLKPDDHALWASRATIYHCLGMRKEALKQNARILEINPEMATVHNNMAWLLATSPEDELRDGARAVTHARFAIASSGQPHPAYVGTMAAAYAEAGDFDKAVEWATRFLNESPPEENVAEAKRRLELYRRRMPFREDPDGAELVRDNRTK